jgi:hypothetical protein
VGRGQTRLADLDDVLGHEHVTINAPADSARRSWAFAFWTFSQSGCGGLEDVVIYRVSELRVGFAKPEIIRSASPPTAFPERWLRAVKSDTPAQAWLIRDVLVIAEPHPQFVR